MSNTRLPDRWYAPERPAVSLRAAAALYGMLVRLRRSLYAHGVGRQVQLPVPVVMVGNVTVGGTGKTPLTLWLAAALIRAGRRPGIVCRSYAARAATPGSVAPNGDPAYHGDEAVLLAARAGCPVWSGPQRARTAQAMVAAHPEIDVVICDDGLQHYALHRDVEIAVVDAVRGFGNGRLLPAGPLREPLARLDRVDAVVLNGVADVAGLPDRVPRVRMRLVGERFEHLGHPGHTREARDFAGKRLTALAGIGHPERFFDHLRSLGLAFATQTFPDHHRYAPADIAALDADCVLMTEKDAIKCARFADERMWMLPVKAEVDAALLDILLGRIEATRAAQR
jgi:tetraacyldisaccharide 4'-kinase